MHIAVHTYPHSYSFKGMSPLHVQLHPPYLYACSNMLYLVANSSVECPVWPFFGDILDPFRLKAIIKYYLIDAQNTSISKNPIFHVTIRCMTNDMNMCNTFLCLYIYMYIYIYHCIHRDISWYITLSSSLGWSHHICPWRGSNTNGGICQSHWCLEGAVDQWWTQPEAWPNAGDCWRWTWD